MKIVNIGKFIKSIIIVLGIIFIITLCFSNVTFSNTEVGTKTVYVSKGETLWTIARYEKENNFYYENKDIRDIVSEIKKLNNIENNTSLKIGQELLVYYI